ncbi:MAG TPA: hypothetical protein VFK87_11825, partial [Steroidobacteraceae bacterium]|nr:hypothetical protein [Steroidobacteraceae bacterium]
MLASGWLLGMLLSPPLAGGATDAAAPPVIPSAALATPAPGLAPPAPATAQPPSSAPPAASPEAAAA